MFQIHDALFEDQQKQIKKAIQLAESSNDAFLKELLVDSPFFPLCRYGVISLLVDANKNHIVSHKAPWKVERDLEEDVSFSV